MESATITQENRFEPTRGVIPTLSPLTVDIEDDRLLKYLKGLEKEANTHWNGDKINLKARREQNFKYRFGKQLIGLKLKEYESEFIDNVIYEFEKTLKAMATSKMPDMIIEAGGIGNNPERKLTAEMLTKALAKIVDDDKTKMDLGMMFQHMPVYLIAAKKYRHDPKDGYVEEVINPEHIVLDHTALSANPDEMLFIIHYVEKTAKEWTMLFPKKKNEINEYVKSQHPGATDDENDWLLAQKVRVAECWYDWIDEAEDFDAEKNPAFDFYSGVAWMLSDTVLLGKTKNPNWDYEGHDVTTMNGEPIAPEMMEQVLQAQLMGQPQPQGFEVKRVYNNYFKRPKKPFIFMTFDQFLKSAIDETSRIEQNIPLQKSMDNVERQTDYMVKSHKGKHMWSADSGMNKKELKKLDLDNPNMDIVGVKGDLDKSHKFLQPEMPPGEMFMHIQNRRDRMFAKASVHGATRGEVTTQVATTNQIAREADFTTNDDLVNSTILHTVKESLKARLHMMKLRYTQKDWQELAGIEEGKYLDLRLGNDSIDDGMEVTCKASTTDKLRAERNAESMAGLGMIGPYHYMKDLGVANVEDRVEELYLWNNNMDLWYQKYGKGKDIPQLAEQVTQQTQIPAAAPVEGEVVPPPAAPAQAPMTPSPTDTSNVATTPQGTGGGMLAKAGSAIKNMLFQPQ